MDKRVMCAVCLLFCMTAYAQEEEPSAQLEQLGEQVEHDVPLPEEDEQTQTLQGFSRRKLNLNTADAGALQSLGLLNALQVSQFLAYRKLLGALISIYELQAVPGFDLPLIRRLLLFVEAGAGLDPYYTWRDYVTRGRHVALLRYSRPLQTARGYQRTDSTAAHYNGSAEKIMMRYRYQLSRYVSWGVVMEKDAGEQFFKGAQRKGFDHYGFHVFMQRMGRIKALALGDFTVNIGQGLVQWHGLAFGKSAAVMQVKREGEVLRPYASAGEFFFYRGVGITYQWGRWELTGFGSRRGLDARGPGDSVADAYSGSLVSAGYHRTAAELALRGNVLQHSAGAVVKWRHGNGHLAWNIMAHQFSKALLKGDEMYRLYGFEGNRYLNTSVDHAFGWRNFHFFGEAALDRQKRFAVLQGMLASLSHGADIAMVYRHESPAYQTLYGNAFGESATVSNESGLYMGLLLKRGSRWELSAYADVFRFPWLKYRISKPSEGYDALIALAWRPDKTTELTMQYRYDSKPQNAPAHSLPQYYVVHVQRQQLRCQFSMQPLPLLTWKCRVVAGRYHDTEKSSVREAWMVYQQWQLKWGRSWRFSAGHTWFDTAEGDGLFLSGQGFPGDNSLQRMSGRGWSAQVQAQYRFSGSFSLWCRWQHEVTPGMKETGSGWDLVQGNKRSNLQVQMQWEFK